MSLVSDFVRVGVSIDRRTHGFLIVLETGDLRRRRGGSDCRPLQERFCVGRPWEHGIAAHTGMVPASTKPQRTIGTGGSQIEAAGLQVEMHSRGPDFDGRKIAGSETVRQVCAHCHLVG